MSVPDETINHVYNEAEADADFHGVQCIVIVVDKDGAYKCRNTPSMNINTAIGVLTRAATEYALYKSGVVITTDKATPPPQPPAQAQPQSPSV